MHFTHGDRPLAEDAVQDTMLRAVKYWESFQPGTNLRGWLFTILRHVWFDTSNKKQEVTDIDSLADELTNGRGADEEALARISIAEALEAIEGMPAYYAQVMRLVVMEDMTYAEAATQLGIPLGTAMSGVFRARQHLKRGRQ